MSLSRCKRFVKRSQSSIPSLNNFQRHSGAEHLLTCSGHNKGNKTLGEHNTRTSENTERVPQEEQTELNRRIKDFLTVSWQKDPQSGLLSETTGKTTNFYNSEQILSCDEELTIQRLSKEQGKDACFVSDAFMLTGTTDGRLSRQEFTNSYANEFTPTGDSARFGVPEDKMNSFMSFDCGSIPRAKRGLSSGKVGVRAQNNDNDIPRAAGQLQQSIPQGFEPHPRENDFLSIDGFSLEGNSSFDSFNNIPTQHPKSTMSQGCGVIPRPKKRDSTRRPKFTDDLMLSRDIDQILEEEVGEFDITDKAIGERREDIARREFHRQLKIAGQTLLARDLEYILNDDIPPRLSSKPDKRSLFTKINDNNNNFTVSDRNVGSKENVENVALKATTSATQSRKMLRLHGNLIRQKKTDDNDVLTLTQLSEGKVIQRETSSQMRYQTKLSTDKKRHLKEIELDESINEIMEIPVFASNIPTKDRVEKIIASAIIAPAFKPKNDMEVNNDLRREALSAGSRDLGHKRSEDCTIEELVAELFPDLLPYVLPIDVPDTDVTDSEAQTLERDSASSVTEVDVLRPMAAGLTKPASAPFYFSGRCHSTHAKKWTTGVIYTDAELKLMAEIERDYSVSGK